MSSVKLIEHRREQSVKSASLYVYSEDDDDDTEASSQTYRMVREAVP